MSGKTNVFFGGVPTAPDVKKLMDHFGVPEENVLLNWTEIEEVIGEEKGSSRFTSVTGAWRKKLRKDHNIEMIPEIGKGLKAANPHERVDLAGGLIHKATNSIKRSISVADKTDVTRLDEEHKKRHTFLSVLGGKMRMLFINEQKKLPTGE